MVLEKLGQSLRDVLKKIANASYIDQEIVKDVIKDIQRAMLQADVNVKLVVEMTKRLESRALTEKPPAGMSSREHVIRIIYDEIVKILGETHELQPKKQRILLVGLYGQGKTTTAGKL
ncbi:MAG: signal recognition particle receptor subunit alpha, partial [Thermoplasmata archaeon]|nr:signal recognition particle receptor subunit alpha [Thermoplasmata archaeon]